jgi:hypothetical protein
MTQTIQHRSAVFLDNTVKNLYKDKPQTEDNISLLLSLFDSLNNLYEKLSKLDYLIQRKNMELSIYRCCKGEMK